ncbi:Type III secretion system translocon subunit SctE [Sulfidibacter corallicola]|uniref:Type III secretion system translocon subunit SctE n=1 Tax=Sulfidibacter corallicola TaxID=2818388 RepID=A0A8A4TNY2_SULCO|nr:type III secretion system translocon subunit SctE [Sulfidibacter corallicola]QTD51137.1 type III secretion system translocon subunit SctE [Sulfidibacter corallicola]
MTTVGGSEFSTIPNAYGAEIENAQDLQNLQKVLDNVLTVLSEKELTLDGAPPKGDRPVLEVPNTDLKSADEMALALLELKSAINEAMQAFSKEDIKNNMVKNKSAHKERLGKLQEAIDKMKEAQKSSKIGKIFGWIAAAATLVAAVAATILTGGAAAPLLAAAALNMTVMILQETGAMDKIVEFMAKGIQELGGLVGLDISEEDAKMAAQIIVMAAVLAANIAAMVMSGGATASTTISMMTKQIATIVQIGAEVASAASMVAQGSAQIASSVQTNDAMQAQGDAKDFQKLMAKLQAMMEEEMERLRELIENMQNNVSVIMQIMGSSSQSISQTTRNMV